MLDLALLVIMAVAPGVFLTWFYWNKDKYEREPRKCIFKVFLLGMLSTIPAALLEAGLMLPMESLAASFLNFYLIVGPVEEGVKFASVLLGIYKSYEFNEVMDGIVYAVSAALGFATVENVIYVLRGGLETAVLRAILSVPAHALFSGIMGFYIGLSKFRVGKLALLIQGYLIASVLHGTWDFLATLSPFLGILLLTGLLLSMYGFLKGKIKYAEFISPFKPIFGGGLAYTRGRRGLLLAKLEDAYRSGRISYETYTELKRRLSER